MKILKASLIAVIVVLLLSGSSIAQSKKLLILVRHAEKDVSATADPGDPNLSPEGLQRAQRLHAVSMWCHQDHPPK